MSLFDEFRRGTVWKVASVYVASSWGVVGIVDFATDQVGLPDWTPTMALVIALIGLPVVVATAMIQGSVARRAQPWPGEMDDGAAPAEAQAAGDVGGAAVEPAAAPQAEVRGAGLFTWSNTLRGGIAAAALLGLAVAGYFLSWSTGIGPVGNLVAQGVIAEGDPLLLGDFENRSDDPDLARTVTEALRVDLGASDQFALVDPTQVDNLLELMRLDGDTPLRGEVARDLAIRGGIAALVEGSVADAGDGFILTASVRAAQSGETVATFRQTASGPGELVQAIDGLSQDIRERTGESLRSIKAGAPLASVTTESLEALRLYALSLELGEAGEEERAIERVRDALEIDPEFAMAHRQLAVLLQNAGREPEAASAAARRAWELRDRLTPREQLLAEAYYLEKVAVDPVGAMWVYEELLEWAPDDPRALNNLAVLYTNFDRRSEAAALLQRAVDGPGASRSAWLNLPMLYLDLREVDRAVQVLERALEIYPDDSRLSLTVRRVVRSAARDWPAAEAALEAQYRLDFQDADDRYLLPALGDAVLLAARGQVGEARRILAERYAGAVERGYGGEMTALVMATRLLVERIFNPDGYVPLLLQVAREDVPAGRVPPPELAAVAGELLMVGEDEAAAEVIRMMGLAMEGLPIFELFSAIDEATRAALRRAQEPAAALETFEVVEARLGCADCLARYEMATLAAAGDFVALAEMRARPEGMIWPREVYPLSVMEARLAEARAWEAAGESARAVEAYRAVRGALDRPDAEAQAFIAELDETIGRLDEG